MAITAPSTDVHSTIIASAHPLVGGIYVAENEQPYYTSIITSLYHLGQSSFGHLQVRKDDANNKTIHISPGSAMIAGTLRTLAAADTIDLTDGDVTYVWAEESGGDLVINSAVDGVGWPSTAHVKLAEVTVASGTFEETDIVDRRPSEIFTADAAIAAPSGGATQDAEARTAIGSILTALENANIIAS